MICSVSFWWDHIYNPFHTCMIQFQTKNMHIRSCSSSKRSLLSWLSEYNHGHHHHDHHRSPLWPIANWPSSSNVTLTIMIVLITLVILIIMIVIGMPFVFTGRTCARPVGPDSWLNRGWLVRLGSIYSKLPVKCPRRKAAGSQNHPPPHLAPCSFPTWGKL